MGAPHQLNLNQKQMQMQTDVVKEEHHVIHCLKAMPSEEAPCTTKMLANDPVKHCTRATIKFTRLLLSSQLVEKLVISPLSAMEGLGITCTIM